MGCKISRRIAQNEKAEIADKTQELGLIIKFKELWKKTPYSAEKFCEFSWKHFKVK